MPILPTINTKNIPAADVAEHTGSTSISKTTVIEKEISKDIPLSSTPSISKIDTMPALPSGTTLIKESIVAEPKTSTANLTTFYKYKEDYLSGTMENVTDSANTKLISNSIITKIPEDGSYPQTPGKITIAVDFLDNADSIKDTANKLRDTLAWSDTSIHGISNIRNAVPYVRVTSENSLTFINTDKTKTFEGIYTLTSFSFEYLSFLLFEKNINESIPSLYRSVDTIIKYKVFDRTEDPIDELYEDEQNALDDNTKQTILSRIWAIAKNNGSTVVKNIIAFYVYFNRRLRFLPLLIQGTSYSDFISNLSAETIIDKLLNLGLYPVSEKNLFNRLWDSFIYSVQKDRNQAEKIMSIGEYYSYDANRNLDETFNGFNIKKDKLVILYELEPSLWSNKRTFNARTVAFSIYKDIALSYVESNENIKNYLRSLLPDAGSLYMKNVISNTGLAMSSKNLKAPDKRLWCTMQSFDNEFKINRLLINKDNIEVLFSEFVNSDDFSINDLKYDNYDDIWNSWATHLNNEALKISTELVDPAAIDHDYKNMFDKLVNLINSKFIFQYLENNEVFSSTYLDGTTYIDNAISAIYASIAVLKAQIKEAINYITKMDRRFYASII